MMKREIIAIADVYVPIKRRATLEQKRVDEIALSILDNGLQAPILVRPHGARFVLVEGLIGLRPSRRSAKRPSCASSWIRGGTLILEPSRRNLAKLLARARRAIKQTHGQ